MSKRIRVKNRKTPRTLGYKGGISRHEKFQGSGQMEGYKLMWMGRVWWPG